MYHLWMVTHFGTICISSIPCRCMGYESIATWIPAFPAVSTYTATWISKIIYKRAGQLICLHNCIFWCVVCASVLSMTSVSFNKRKQYQYMSYRILPRSMSIEIQSSVIWNFTCPRISIFKVQKNRKTFLIRKPGVCVLAYSIATTSLIRNTGKTSFSELLIFFSYQNERKNFLIERESWCFKLKLRHQNEYSAGSIPAKTML